jgi:hypothetical protein
VILGLKGSQLSGDSRIRGSVKIKAGVSIDRSLFSMENSGFIGSPCCYFLSSKITTQKDDTLHPETSWIVDFLGSMSRPGPKPLKQSTGRFHKGGVSIRLTVIHGGPSRRLEGGQYAACIRGFAGNQEA